MNDFTVLSQLGEGSFGQVVKVRRNIDNKEYALKKVRISTTQVKFDRQKKKDIENALNEVRILASIDDPYIIRYKEAFYDQTSQSMCIVMELAHGGDLQVH
jgi:NIMA (never in mitosis gene a)-related kinase